MTILANVLVLLRFARVDDKVDRAKRYEQKLGEHGQDVDDRLYGFTVDYWFHGIMYSSSDAAAAHSCFPIRLMGQFKLSGDLGCWEANVADSKFLLSADDHE